MALLSSELHAPVELPKVGLEVFMHVLDGCGTGQQADPQASAGMMRCMSDSTVDSLPTMLTALDTQLSTHWTSPTGFLPTTQSF